MMRAVSARGLLLLLGASLSLGCDDVVTNLVSDPVVVPPPSDAATAGSDAASQDASEVDAALSRALCGGRLCACDDAVSNDDDELVDGLDPECTGAFDDDEATFALGGPTRLGACRDCYWDNNATPNDDGCLYPQQCLEEMSPPARGNCGDSCEPTLTCVTACLTRTPNGCDCFGCCEVTREDGSTLTVALGDDCSMDRLDDDKKCPRCVQNAACLNPCGPCELCPGRTTEDIADACSSDAGAGSTPWQCNEAQSCNTTSDCEGTDWYCQLGCCLPVVL